MIRRSDNEKTELRVKPEGATYSSQHLRLIPMDPEFVPTPSVQEQVVAALAAQFPNNEISSSLYDQVRFVDPGESFESVTCDRCGQQITIDEWQEMMGAAYEKRFSDLTVTPPCCGRSTSLNDLVYQAPSGFSRYVIEIIDPEDPLKDAERITPQIARILGTRLRAIHAHI